MLSSSGGSLVGEAIEQHLRRLGPLGNRQAQQRFEVGGGAHVDESSVGRGVRPAFRSDRLPFRSAATRIVRPAMAGRLRLESHWTRVMANLSKLLTEALDLPVRDRLRLAGALLRSVDPAEDDDEAEAWAAELDRRADSIDDATLIEAPDAHAQVRAALQAQRANAR